MSETEMAQWACMPQPNLNAISCGKKSLEFRQPEEHRQRILVGCVQKEAYGHPS